MEKKLKIYIEMFALVCALSSIAVFVFFLSTNWGEAIYFTEAITPVRIAEIVWGSISLIIIIKMLKERLQEILKWK